MRLMRGSMVHLETNVIQRLDRLEDTHKTSLFSEKAGWGWTLGR